MNNTAELTEALVNELTNRATRVAEAPQSRVIEGLIVGSFVSEYQGYDSSQDVSYWGKKSYAVIFDGEKPVVYTLDHVGTDNWHSPGTPESSAAHAKYTASCEALADRAEEYALLSDDESAEQASAWLDARREAQAIEQANAEREEEIRQELFPAKGKNVLVVKGTAVGTFGRCFWTGAKQVSFHNAILKVGLDAGGARNGRGYAAEPVWTAAGNCVAIPSDCAEIFDASDAGASPLALALAEYLNGRENSKVYEVFQGLAANCDAVAQLRFLGGDLARAIEEQKTTRTLKGKGSTLAKRQAQQAYSAVYTRLCQIIDSL